MKYPRGIKCQVVIWIYGDIYGLEVLLYESSGYRNN